MTTISLTPETHARIAQYASAAKIPVDQAASEAVDKWMDATGDLVLGELERRRSARRKLAIVHRAV